MDSIASINKLNFNITGNNDSFDFGNYKLVSGLLDKYGIKLRSDECKQISPDLIIERFCHKNNITIDKTQLDKNINSILPTVGDSIDMKSLLMVVSLGGQRSSIADDILSGMNNSVDSTREIRDNIKEQLHELAIELKIFSIIQSHINKAMSSSKQEIAIDNSGQNLLDPSLYGMTAKEFNGPPPSKEKVFLDKIVGKETMSGDVLSIKYFLQSDKKSSPAMTGLDNTYSYDKNNNKLGHFASMVGDITRPLNDLVNEKSTQLNEASNIYNSSIEALTRFIQKLDTLLQDLSRSL
ncbi:virulence-associated V antigen [Morganella psychrotolerans]|uniref:virulence-associated V antigen n=1 Tax=Morganella psychrotolerans TaxID=368603 RepID=UPI0039AEAC09